MTDNNIVSKIQDINKESESQIDRNNMEELSKNTMFTFLNKYIEKISGTSALKQKVDKMLFEKLEKEEDTVPYGVLLKLEEILSKGETDAATPILKILEASIRVKKEADQLPPPDQNTNTDGNVTTDEIKKLKDLLQLIDVHNKLKQTEFNEGER